MSKDAYTYDTAGALDLLRELERQMEGDRIESNDWATYEGDCPNCGDHISGTVRPLSVPSPSAPAGSGGILTRVWEPLECVACGQRIVPTLAPLEAE